MELRYLTKKIIYLVNILIPLFLGTVLYIAFRQDTYIARWFYRIFHIEFLIEANENICVKFIQNYMCDMLWAYALMMALWLASGKTMLYRVGMMTFLFTMLVECLQIIELMKGTFDVWDILLEGIAISIATFAIERIEKDADEDEKEIDIGDNSTRGILDDGYWKRF